MTMAEPPKGFEGECFPAGAPHFKGLIAKVVPANGSVCFLEGTLFGGGGGGGGGGGVKPFCNSIRYPNVAKHVIQFQRDLT